MTTPIKTSHGIAILTGCLLVAIALIAWSSREIARSTSLSILVNPRSQTANVSDFDNELVGHWTFDEGSGTTANDSSNNGNTGALTSSSMWTTQAAVGSGALQFDGSSSKVTLSNQTLHGGTETWSAWVYMPNVSTGGTILYKSDNDSSDGWMLYIDTSAELWLRLSTVNCSGSDFYAHSSSAAVTSNQWYLVTATWNGALNSNSDITLYVNGNPVSSTGTSCPGATHNDSQSYTPYIGYGGSGAAGYFTGSIDDVRVYNQALSASQIQQLYALGAGGGTPPSSPTLTPFLRPRQAKEPSPLLLQASIAERHARLHLTLEHQSLCQLRRPVAILFQAGQAADARE